MVVHLLCHHLISFNERKWSSAVLFFQESNEVMFWTTWVNDDGYIWQLSSFLINILIALMLVTSTAPFVVVSDMTTRGRSRDVLSTGNVLAKQSWVMIGTHSSECWIQDQCKHSATAQLQRAGCVRYPRFFLLCFP